MGKDPRDVDGAAVDAEAAAAAVPDADESEPDVVEEVLEEPVEEEPVVTDEDEDEPSPEPPRLVDLDELKARARKASEPEERAKRGLPFPIMSLGIEVIVAATHGKAMYEDLFARGNDFFETEDGKQSVDIAFIKSVVLNCVVQPVLDDEALELIIENDSTEFSMLAKFCWHMTQVEGLDAHFIRLGEISTEAQQLSFDAMLGSTNSQTPASRT